MDITEWAEQEYKELCKQRGEAKPAYIRKQVPRRILDQHEYIQMYDVVEAEDGTIRYKISMQPSQLDYELDEEYLKRQKWESEIY